MISVFLFDLFFVALGLCGATRLISGLRTGSVVYKDTDVSRAENPATFWVALLGYVGMGCLAAYGIATS